MQRSIGKKILATVAGVGIAVGGAGVMAPSASGAPVYIDYITWTVDYSYIDADGKFVKNNYWTSQETVVGVGNEAGYAAPAAAGEALEDCNELIAAGCTLTHRIRSEFPDEEGIEEIALAPAPPPPPPCWSNFNCPVGGAVQVAVPEYMIAGVPQQLVVYASWRPDASTMGAPTNGDAVISMDGDPVAAAPFVDGKATLSFTPTKPGLKNAVISGVLNSNTSGANAWIDSVNVATMVLEWDPEALEEALKNKKVEVGDTYTLEEIAQAKTALGKRLEWRVAQDSKDVCAVTTTKKGEVRAKFTESGKCSIIWTDPKKDEEGKYTFKVTA